MFKIKFIPALLLAVFLICGGGVADNTAHATRHLIVNNDSGETVVAIYCVSINYEGWGNDILDGDYLQNGWYQTINFADHVRYVKLKTYFSGGRYKYWDSIDLDYVGSVSVTPYGR